MYWIAFHDIQQRFGLKDQFGMGGLNGQVRDGISEVIFSI
jgi:hypothetical protein